RNRPAPPGFPPLHAGVRLPHEPLPPVLLGSFHQRRQALPPQRLLHPPPIPPIGRLPRRLPTSRSRQPLRRPCPHRHRRHSLLRTRTKRRERLLPPGAPAARSRPVAALRGPIPRPLLHRRRKRGRFPRTPPGSRSHPPRGPDAPLDLTREKQFGNLP